MNNKKTDIDLDGIIIDLVKAYDKKRGPSSKKIYIKTKHFDLAIGNCRYVLQQIFRQIIIDDKHWHISKKANNELKNVQLTHSINDYLLNANLSCKKKGKSVKFNSIFTVDHIKPVNKILNELVEEVNKGNIDKSKIKAIINKTHLCIITKEEDKELNKNHFRKNRDGNYEYITKSINGAYKICKIEIDDKNKYKNIDQN